MKSFPAHAAPRPGTAASTRNALKAPIMTFSAQNSSMTGNNSQPQNSTPINGTKLERTSTATLGVSHDLGAFNSFINQHSVVEKPQSLRLVCGDALTAGNFAASSCLSRAGMSRLHNS